MKKSLPCLAVIAAIAGTLMTPISAEPRHAAIETKAALGQRVAPDAQSEIETLVDAVVKEAMVKDHFAGATVAIVRNDELQLLKGYGLASAAPVRPVDPSRSLFRIGSVSKTVTWILLLRLVEEGKVDLSRPVNDYLPADLRVPDQGFAKPILVRNLLDHSPGFEDIALGHLFAPTPDKIIPMHRYATLHRPSRVREPGQFSTYSNYGVVLAGVIIERIRGKDFATVADEEFFKPLGMNRSTFREPYPARAGLPAPMPAALSPDVAQANVWQAGRFKPLGFEYITGVAPAGSVSSTAADMSRFLQLLLNEGELDGVRIFGPTTAKLLRTPLRLNAAPGVNSWAHGFIVTELPGGLKGYGHGGATQYFRTYMMVVPDLRLGIFISVNSPTGNSVIERLPIRLVAALSGRAELPDLQRPPAASLVADAARYSGTYQTTRRAYSGLEKAFGLLTPIKVVVDPTGYLVTQMGPDTKAWVPTGEPGTFINANGYDKLRFNLDKAGNASSFDVPLGVARYERAPIILDPAVLMGLAALALVISGFGLWNGIRRLRRKQWVGKWQFAAAVTPAAASAAWLATGIAGAVAVATIDPLTLLYTFPGAPLRTMASLAFAATWISIVMLVVTLFAWRWAKEYGKLLLVRQTLASLVFVALGYTLAQWGFLSPLS